MKKLFPKEMKPMADDSNTIRGCFLLFYFKGDLLPLGRDLF